MKNQITNLTPSELTNTYGGGTSDVGEWLVDTIASGICNVVSAYNEFSSRANKWGSGGYSGGRFTA